MKEYMVNGEPKLLEEVTLIGDLVDGITKGSKVLITGRGVFDSIYVKKEDIFNMDWTYTEVEGHPYVALSYDVVKPVLLEEEK